MVGSGKTRCRKETTSEMSPSSMPTQERRWEMLAQFSTPRMVEQAGFFNRAEQQMG
jgi:hypothetical protein